MRTINQTIEDAKKKILDQNQKKDDDNKLEWLSKKDWWL
jgi:hypothetical protein